MNQIATVDTQGQVTELNSCLACGGRHLKQYINLGAQPLANDYHDGTQELARFPLGVNVCLDCFHSQLTHSVDADLLYKNYLYVSGTTTTLLISFDEFVDHVEATFPSRRLRVLDIASNDGSLLRSFALRGHTVLGVDPAENLVPLSEANTVPTHVGYWGPETARLLSQKFDVIVAMNVLGHVPYPKEFLSACREVLAPDGRVYIQTSQSEMVRRFEFDTVYHEHHSFFTTRSFRTLAGRAGLSVVEGVKVPVHGTSYLWTLAGAGETGETVLAMLEEEAQDAFYVSQTYDDFGASVRQTLDFVRRTVSKYKRRGYAVIGYGAAAKGNTLLNAAGLSLDYIVDDNPLKVGLRTPGTDTPIVPVQSLSETEAPLCVIVLAWNFYDEIRQRISAERRRPDDVFVQYFPQQQVRLA